MAGGARGRSVKPSNQIVKATKSSTPSSKKHHFESFSQRVARLNIDPIHRTRRHDLDETNLVATESYFNVSLQKWQDINLSENFTRFLRDVRPLCESLPQILHFQDRIVDILIQYLEEKDALSLEPLLSLVADLAHDLGIRFERCFARVATVVSKLASQHPNIEVVEWSFNCLAWLFKYLSKLLIPDLRSLFDLMAPLLGKERQKPFVARFAAEAMSFLVRKAGAIYQRDQSPLENIVSHALKDLIASADHCDTTLYSQGLMTLFVEAVNSAQKGLHTCAESVIRCLTQQTLHCSRAVDELKYSPGEVLLGVLTAINHHADGESCRLTLAWVLQNFDLNPKSGAHDSTLLTDVLFVAISTAKRRRDLDWFPIIDAVSALIKQPVDRYLHVESLRKGTVRVFAMVIAFAPFDKLVSHLHLLDNMKSVPWEEHFLSLCIYSASIDPSRFQSLLLPHLQKYGPRYELRQA